MKTREEETSCPLCQDDFDISQGGLPIGPGHRGQPCPRKANRQRSEHEELTAFKIPERDIFPVIPNPRTACDKILAIYAVVACASCQGAGRVNHSPRGYAELIKCSYCAGTGRCEHEVDLRALKSALAAI